MFRETTQNTAMEFEVSTFKVGNTLFGINIQKIEEINKNFEITQVPQSSEYIKGILNLRGKIVTIIDLGKKLGLTSVNKNRENRNVIVNSGGEYIGLMVDAINDVVMARKHDFEPAPANLGGVKGKFFQGILKTEKELIGILDIDEILKD